MTISELADKMERVDELIIKYYDDNMNMERNIDYDDLQRFIANHPNTEVLRIFTGSFRVIAQIQNPNK